MADDLLADLLSDNDDSLDSFYNLDKAGTSKQTNKQPITATTSNKHPKSNTAESWLGLDLDLELEPKKPTSILHRDDGPSRKKPAKKISFEDDDDDILGTLGMAETQKPETAKPSQRPKSAIMEDIFGPSKPIGDHRTSLEDILKDSVVAKSNKKETAVVTEEKYVASSGAQQEGRMSRRQSSAVFDSLTSSIATDPPALRQPRPLSRQSSADKPTEELTVATNKTPSKSLPDWLGGSPSKPKPEPDLSKPEKEQDITDKPSTVLDSTITLPLENHPSLDSLFTQQKLSASQIGYQNTSIALQQQESQLLVALQLKKYEENLMGMQKKQQDILIKQEQQFNSLLERQFAKQQMMENNMRLQQERINNHIQLLVAAGPSTGVGAVINEDREKVAELERVVVEENSHMYEKIISVLKERHREEVFVMEESYKKQISYLEQQIEATENKLKSETASFSETLHQEKLALKLQYESETENWKHKLQESRAAHASELKLVRENHERIIEEIKYEYSSMVDNLKRIKAAEVSVLENGSEYSKKLDVGLERLLENSRELEAIGGNVRAEYGVLTVAREASIDSREKEVYLMRSALEKARESTETERSQLVSLIRSLELKLVEQSENAREERWAFQQATATLAARAQALDRETEFNRASLERERNQLKSLKESLLREQEKAVLELTEEKLRVSAERTSLETSAKLKHNYDSQKANKDAEAAIRVAKESTEQTDRERDILYKQQAEVEALKRSLFDKEQKLNFRESELQSVIQGAERKAAEGERALLESKSLQAKYNERLKQIQRQLGSLANRERKLGEDKIALSKERLAFQSSLREFSRCSLCRSNVKVPQERVEEFEEAVEQDVPMPRFMVSDPELLRLRYELIEEQHPEQHIEESHTSL